jgi:PKD repeat protein
MGGGSTGAIRSATTTTIDASLGGFLSFNLIIGSQPWPNNCEMADSSTNEHVYLMASINGGISWDTINIYRAQSLYANWTPIFEPIPSWAFSSATIFRWIQFYSNGIGNDQWALDDVSVTCILPTDPPISFFSVSPTFTCYGIVDFTNKSVGLVDTSIFCYGDGTCDTLLGATNVQYTYTTSSIFNVTLTTINANGRHDTTINGAVNVSLGGGPPPFPCTPGTGSTCCNAGILNVTINGINHSSGNAASEGYADNSCTESTDLFAGTSEPISVTTGAVDMVRVWIDWNADTVFDKVTEQAFWSDSTNSHSGFVDVPPYPEMNTPLRMRVANAPYGLYANLPTCDTLNYGQYEDYTIIVRPNPSAPAANFYSHDTLTCDGKVSFFDLSNNVPTSWLWKFGDGNTDTAKNPDHTYQTPGKYTVTLIAFNGNGQDSLVRNLFIDFQQGTTPRTPKCIPNTLFANCLGYGIYRFQLFGESGVDVSSDCGDEGYVDFTCLVRDTLIEERGYGFKLKTNPSLPQDTWMWLDMDNDGEFEFDDELVVQITNEIDAQGTIKVPFREMDSLAYGIPLRLRVGSDFTGAGLHPCSNPSFGQFEDYTIVVERNTDPPIAAFGAENTTVCPGNPVQFIDSSLNVIKTWKWDMGDGTFSYHPEPNHYYTSPGVYPVTLRVCNDFGCDSITKLSYVNVNNKCAYNVGVEGEIRACEGELYDDGGPGANYTDSKDLYTILRAPCDHQGLTLKFTSFNFSSQDTLLLYDGDKLSDPRTFYTNSTSTPPDYIASGSAIGVRQKTNNFTNQAGFGAEWICDGGPCADFKFNPSLSDQCVEDYTYVNLSSLATTNSWNFGDGGTASSVHPSHSFTSAWDDSMYWVSLIVTNSMGADTLIKGLRRYKIDGGMRNTSDPKAIFIGHSPFGFVTFYDTSNYWINKWEWELGEGTKSRIKNPTHIYDSIGLYTVKLTVSNTVCEETIIRYQWVLINDGIEGMDANNFMTVYPNPTNGEMNLFVTLENRADITVRVISMFGQEVYQKRHRQTGQLNERISLDGLPKGIYFVRMETGEREMVQKIIVQ